MKDIIAYGIGRADYLEGMVRLEMVLPVPGDAGPTSEPRYAVHMPLEAFLRSAATINGLIEKLSAAGIIMPASAPASTPAAAPTALPARGPSSPNFA